MNKIKKVYLVNDGEDIDRVFLSKKDAIKWEMALIKACDEDWGLYTQDEIDFIELSLKLHEEYRGPLNDIVILELPIVYDVEQDIKDSI